MDKLVIGEWDLTRTSKNHRFIYCPGKDKLDFTSLWYAHEVTNFSYFYQQQLRVIPIFDFEQGDYFDMGWWFV